MKNNYMSFVKVLDFLIEVASKGQQDVLCEVMMDLQEKLLEKQELSSWMKTELEIYINMFLAKKYRRDYEKNCKLS